MTNDEILQAAKEAEQTLYYKSFLAYYAVIEQLVRDVERKTIERCAAICQDEMDEQYIDSNEWYAVRSCRETIRKLGEQ